ncbi:MAG: CHRD domain-containing protein [Pyrinomonadaceae bacterium]|nr:CHRD domain-containing protein [Pyrinomonadaceae bacterium]
MNKVFSRAFVLIAYSLSLTSYILAQQGLSPGTVRFGTEKVGTSRDVINGQMFVARLSGLQVVPQSNSPGTGSCVFTLDPTQTSLRAACRYENFTNVPIRVGFGYGAPLGQTGSSNGLIGIENGGQSGAFYFTVGLSYENLVNLRSNRTYIFVNSNSSTEVRGQIHLANGAYNDFDGDGRTDLTVYRNSTNKFYAKPSLIGGLLEKQIGHPGDAVMQLADFDGDARSDFSTIDYSGQILWRINQSQTNSTVEVNWGSSGLSDYPAPADYDGDAKFDIAVFRAGVWYVIESSTNTVRNYYFGRSGDIPVPNDFDKDGQADLTVARSEDGKLIWYVRRSTDNRVYATQWGLSSDEFFVGRSDWDGDGAQDLSVIRNESGQKVFYILRSFDQELQIIRWGLDSDLLKLGDYDGDGRTDVAVTRSINGHKIFFILESSTGEPRYETFGFADDL